MKIKNIKKFVKMVMLILGIIIGIIIVFSNNSYSKGEAKTKEFFVSSGDTLWSIASYEKKNNGYYQDKDIREIIYEIKQMNNLQNKSILVVGQKLELHTI